MSHDQRLAADLLGTGPSAPWRPTPLISASIGAHAALAPTMLVHPDLWPWMLGGVAANHVVLGAIGLWPRSTLLGPNLTRLPAASRARGEVAITFDDGPDPQVTPAVLDILDAHGARASFFCIAEAAARHPGLCREIVRRGHAIENHSRAHRAATFPFLGLAGFRREIGGAQEELTRAAGEAPRFFRPPAGLRNPLLEPILHQLGLSLATWTRRGYDTREGDPGEVARRLLKGLAAGDILLLHDGNAARTAAGEPMVVRVLPTILEAIAARSLTPVTLRQSLQP